MTGPTLTRRGYELDGALLPRVSTILATVHKAGIWAKKLELAAETGDPHAADKAWEPSRDLGTAIHKATEAWDRDAELPADDTLRPYVDAYRTWRPEFVADVLDIERVVWSPTLRYAGTLDRIYRMRDNRVLLGDIKSSKSVDGLYRAQLSAYSLALAECAGIHVDGRAVIHLPSNQPGTCRLVEYDDDAQDMLTWRSLVWLYHWWASHSEDWKATQ